MKKLMVALCAVALAAVSQAAQVNWSASGLVDINGTAWKDSTQFSTYSVAVTFFDASGSELLTTTGSFTQNFGSFSGSWKSTDDPAPALSTSYYAQMIITDKDGNTLTSEKAEFATTGSSTRSITFSNGTNFKTTGNKFDQTGDTHGWQSVPEPTSGLLLLLGVAGLALRRRRA